MDLNLLTATEADALDRLIAGAGRMVLTGHSRPDGDAIGSMLALAAWIEARYGRQPDIVVPNAWPDFLQWLPGTERIIRHDKRPADAEAALAGADLVFAMDYNDADRLEDLRSLLDRSTARRVMIDHHLAPQMDCAFTVSHPELSSTSELVFRLVWQLGGWDLVDKRFAVPVYTGMMTDTGGFTYNSTRPEIYYIICQLLTKKIDKDRIYRNVYNNYSAWAIRLRGYLMSQRLNVLADAHATYYSMTRQDMRTFHYVRGDAEGLVNEPLRIRGVKLSISLREDDRVDRRIWVSLRSVDDYDVEQLARRYFNGGGHRNAAGGRLDCTLAEAEQTVRQAIADFGRQFAKPAQ